MSLRDIFSLKLSSERFCDALLGSIPIFFRSYVNEARSADSSLIKYPAAMLHSLFHMGNSFRIGVYKYSGTETAIRGIAGCGAGLIDEFLEQNELVVNKHIFTTFASSFAFGSGLLKTIQNSDHMLDGDRILIELATKMLGLRYTQYGHRLAEDWSYLNYFLPALFSTAVCFSGFDVLRPEIKQNKIANENKALLNQLLSKNGADIASELGEGARKLGHIGAIANLGLFLLTESFESRVVGNILKLVHTLTQSTIAKFCTQVPEDSPILAEKTSNIIRENIYTKQMLGKLPAANDQVQALFGVLPEYIVSFLEAIYLQMRAGINSKLSIGNTLYFRHDLPAPFFLDAILEDRAETKAALLKAEAPDIIANRVEAHLKSVILSGDVSNNASKVIAASGEKTSRRDVTQAAQTYTEISDQYTALDDKLKNVYAIGGMKTLASLVYGFMHGLNMHNRQEPRPELYAFQNAMPDGALAQLQDRRDEPPMMHVNLGWFFGPKLTGVVSAGSCMLSSLLGFEPASKIPFSYEQQAGVEIMRKILAAMELIPDNNKIHYTLHRLDEIPGILITNYKSQLSKEGEQKTLAAIDKIVLEFGKIYAVSGNSGCGKSTWLNTLIPHVPICGALGAEGIVSFPVSSDGKMITLESLVQGGFLPLYRPLYESAAYPLELTDETRDVFKSHLTYALQKLKMDDLIERLDTQFCSRSSLSGGQYMAFSCAGIYARTAMSQGEIALIKVDEGAVGMHLGLVLLLFELLKELSTKDTIILIVDHEKAQHNALYKEHHGEDFYHERIEFSRGEQVAIKDFNFDIDKTYNPYAENLSDKQFWNFDESMLSADEKSIDFSRAKQVPIQNFNSNVGKENLFNNEFLRFEGLFHGEEVLQLANPIEAY